MSQPQDQPSGSELQGFLTRLGEYRSTLSEGDQQLLEGRFAERLLTVVASCRQQGRSVLSFLVAAGEAALQRTPAPSLLPARDGD